MKAVVWNERKYRKIVAVMALIVIRVETIRIDEDGEVSEVHQYYFGDDHSMISNTYQWVGSFLDLENNDFTCTTNLILAHLSLTGCECLVSEAYSNDTEAEPQIEMRKPGKRYLIVGGITFRKYTPGLEELSTINFLIHEQCEFISSSRTWIFNYGLIVHEPFKRTPSVPMPVWSAHGDKVELRYEQIIARGEPCFLIGWRRKHRRLVKIRVVIALEPLTLVMGNSSQSDCTRVSCALNDASLSSCPKTAVSCTSNRSMASYCDLEPGMPLVCGTGEVFAITSGSACETDGADSEGELLYTSLWKLSAVMDWLIEIEVKEFKTRSETVSHRDLKDKEEKYEMRSKPNSQPAICKHSGSSSVLVSLVVFAIRIMLLQWFSKQLEKI